MRGGGALKRISRIRRILHVTTHIPELLFKGPRRFYDGQKKIEYELIKYIEYDPEEEYF